MQLLLSRAGLVLNPGQVADLVLAWRQVAGLIAVDCRMIGRSPTTWRWRSAWAAAGQNWPLRLPGAALPGEAGAGEARAAPKRQGARSSKAKAKAKAPRGEAELWPSVRRPSAWHRGRRFGAAMSRCHAAALTIAEAGPVDRSEAAIAG